jgi:riboflavin kinase/FMN adenylyltransferase
MPEPGVYAVDVTLNNQLYRGMLNVGNRPTFGASRKVAEVHILDFDQDIYGETLSITIRKFLRSERAFPTPEALKQQIEHDKTEAAK